MSDKTEYEFRAYWRGGAMWYPPRKEDIQLRGIIKILSRIFRYGGHSNITVAAHSLAVASRVPKSLEPYALLHDAHEAWIGDMVRPYRTFLKHEMEAEFMERSGGLDAEAAVGHYAAFERADAAIRATIDAAIHAACGLDPLIDPADIKAIADADREVAEAEFNGPEYEANFKVEWQSMEAMRQMDEGEMLSAARRLGLLAATGELRMDD